MPILDSVQILLPSAADTGYGTIDTREYPITIFARDDAMVIAVRIEEISYSPAWAKVQMTVFQSDREIERVAGSDGKIVLNIEASNLEAVHLGIENLSIDTDIRVTLKMRSWQYGE